MSCSALTGAAAAQQGWAISYGTMKVGHLPTSFTGFTAPHHAATMFKWGSIPHLVQPISTYSLGICASVHDCQHVSQSPHTLQGRTWSLYGASPLIKKHQNTQQQHDRSGPQKT